MYFVYKNKNCPVIIWDNETLLNPLADVRFLQGLTIGKMQSFDIDMQNEAMLEILTLDTVKCAEMENLSLDEEKVKTAIACKLGFCMETDIEVNGDEIDGITEAMADAVQNCNMPLTEERMLLWHETLVSETKKEKNNETNQISKFIRIKKSVYKAIGKEKTGFRTLTDNAISNFIVWFNTENKLDSVIKAAIAHLWFVTIRPFDDGNARMAGIITNMLLARSDNTSCRFYSVLAQIRSDQKQYHSILEKTQNENFDVTGWLLWFLVIMKKALKATDSILLNVLKKSEFWKIHNKTQLNNRQRLVINKLLDGIDCKLQSSSWAQIAKCSSDTALHDIKDLIKKGILRQKSQGGRSTNYELTEF
jgi:Fic family protein